MHVACVCIYSSMPFACRESIKKNTNVYEDLPLFAIEEKFNKTEGGKQLGNICIAVDFMIHFVVLF